MDEKEIERLLEHWIESKCGRNMTIAQIFETAFRLGIEYGYIAGENNPIQKSWEWIPTTEKLPKQYKESKYTLSSEPVLVTWERPDGTTIWGTSQLINDKWDTGYDEDWNGCKVTAWMPIPKPYKAEKWQT